MPGPNAAKDEVWRLFVAIDVPDEVKQRALQMLADRRRRHEVFGKSMFGEPAWEILLFLYALGPKQTITKLADLAGASKSTTLRWIDYLEKERLIARVHHALDSRVFLLELTEKARQALDRYFGTLSDDATLG